MRKPILIAAATVGLAMAGVGATLSGAIPHALAQPAPADAPMPPPDGPHPVPMGWMHHGPGGHGPWHHMATFALLHRPADRALSGADVQKIAEGFLLWNGNHSWKVTGVTEQDEATVGFNIATPNGDVIARFSMNRHTGEVTRVS